MEQNLSGSSRSKTAPNSTTTIQLPFRDTVTQYQRSLIAQSLSHCEKESRQISAEIRRLKSAIMILETRRHEVEKKVEVYRSLLAPIHKMPPEIMVEIFKHVCSERSQLYQFTDLVPSSPKPHVVTLSMVCSRWRELVNSSSFLWASIAIMNHNPHAGRIHQAIELFLTRSRDQPLDLVFGYYGSEAPSGPLNLFTRECRRWERLLLSSQNKIFHDPHLGRIRGNLFLLTHLTLKGALEDGPFSDVFEVAPCLRSISLSPASVITPSLRLPWQQLRTIDLNDVTLEPILQALALCPNLEQIALGYFQTGHNESTNNPRINLLVASSLSITVPNSRCILDVFRQCDWPHLKSLKICNSGPGLVWDPPLINSLLLRPMHCLASLHLVYVPLPEDEAISLLQQIPTLRTLSIQDIGTCPSPEDIRRATNLTVTSTFLQRLFLPHHPQRPTVSEPAGVFLPQLNTLSLWAHARDLDQHALVNAVVSRCPDTTQTSAKADTEAHSYLRSFSVTVASAKRTESFDTLKSLECFREAGLVVSITVQHLAGEDDEDENEDDEDEDEDEDED